jgi:hypothetical protein
MRLQRAICVSHDPGVRSQVEAALSSAGLTVDHADAIDGLQPPGDDVALVVVDRAARLAAGEALRSIAVPVVVVGDDLDDDGLIALMHDAPVSHLVEDPRDRDLGITSEKLASGDLFGLEKYVAAGAPVGERVVSCDVDRRHAVGEVCAWAESNGARRAVLHRIANAVDELLMNAWYDDGRRAVLRWASDDRTLAISVGDGHGALSQRDVIDHVRRARHDRGRPQPASDGGAGIGLYLVVANVASLVVNVERGRRTEVVCLFDRGLRSAGVRSLHVFASA